MTEEKPCVFGMIGLGTMGRNLLLNMADHGFKVAGYDKNPSQVNALQVEGAGKPVTGYTDLHSFANSLASPKAMMMLVPAGKIVDDVIAEFLPLLKPGDIFIDGGNSHFSDTMRRDTALEKLGIHFFGMGISGGEEGARFGPSMMPGGDKEAYKHLSSLFEAVAAKVDGEPCVTYIGPGASGHFVKMVHNGIEYALMQLIAETYGILKNNLRLSNEEVGDVFKKWNNGRLQSFLLEVTADIFSYKNEDGKTYLLDDIKDEAKAKGTGKWTSQIAMDLQVPVTTIDTAVSMRDLSKFKALRVLLSQTYASPLSPAPIITIQELEEAFCFSMITIYAQGMHMLQKASVDHGYDFNLEAIPKIWRGGCIIRSLFLEDMQQAFASDKNLPHLFAFNNIKQQVQSTMSFARKLTASCIANAIPVPVYSSAISYFDSIVTAQMPSNLIQAQRDYFGAHTYELVGKEGVFHTEWKKI